MNKKIVITLIVVWSCIAVFLGGILIHGVVANRGASAAWLNTDEYAIDDMKAEETTYTFSAEEINNIEVDLTSEDVNIIPTEDKEIKVVYSASNTRRNRQEVRVQQNSETIKVYKISSNKTNLFFNIEYSNAKLDIYMPEGNVSDMDIDLSSGNINIEDMVFNNLKIDQSSGTTQIKKLVCSELKIDKSSGNTELEEVKADIIKVESSSGSLTCENIQAQILEGESSSGNRKFSNCKIDNMQYESTSGEINIEGEYKHINLDSSSGNSRIKLTTMPETIKIHKTSGATTLYLPENEGFQLEYNKSSGNFNSEFELRGSIGDTDHIVAEYGNGNSIIEVESSSGNFDLRVNK